MSERTIGIGWGIMSLTVLASLFMVTQCKEKQDAVYAKEAVVCNSTGGAWDDGLGICVRPKK